MSLIEEADVAQIDRLLEQHGRRNHSSVDEVPSRPHVLPFLDRGESKRSRRFGWLCEEREDELRSFEKPEGILRGTVCPPVHRTKLCFREQSVGVLVRILRTHDMIVRAVRDS